MHAPTNMTAPALRFEQVTVRRSGRTILDAVDWSVGEGERARILLARALATEAELLILDEPAAGLDLPGRELLLRAFANALQARDGLTTITATHHFEELSPATTHVLLLRSGAVVAAGL